MQTAQKLHRWMSQNQTAWSDNCDSDENDEEIWATTKKFSDQHLTLKSVFHWHSYKYTLLNTKIVTSDHENIGIDTVIEMLSCTVA